MANKLKGYATFTNPDGGLSETFGPDDKLPDWAQEILDGDESPAPDESDEDDVEVPGPGQTTDDEPTDAPSEGEDGKPLTQAQKKAAYRARKKAEAEQQDQLAAAQAAEEQRRKESEGGGS